MRVRVVLAALLLVSAAACGGGGGAPASDAGEPRQGGTATVLVVSEARTLDPAQLNNATSTNSAVGNALYGQLVRNDARTGELLPALAEELASPDGTTWTLRLRTGLTFSDGTPFDATAVKANWDRIADPATRSPAIATVGDIVASSVVDARTLTFTLREPNAHFGQAVIANGTNWIASPAALAKGPEAFDAAPVGAGPFVLTEWVRDDRMVLDRNPRYHDAPRPHLDQLVLRPNPDGVQRLQTLQAGDAQLALSINPEISQRAEDVGLHVDRAALNGANQVTFNTARAPFDDVRARQAITAAVDLDALNAAVYGGAATSPTSLFPEGSPFHDPAVTLYPHDPARAQQLFDELGGLTFSLGSFPTTESVKVTQAVQAQLAAYRNVTVQVETLDFAGATARLRSGDFQAMIAGTTFLDPEPQVYQTLRTGSAANFAKVSDPDLDAALLEGRRTTDPASRTAAYRTVQERVRDLVPALYYVRDGSAVMSDESVGGVGFYGQGSVLLDGVWVDGE